MSKKAMVSALLITFMLIIPMTAWAVGTITGTVTEEATTNPVSGLTVRLLDNMGTQLGQATTDGLGIYTFASVADGTSYQVNARGNNSYASQTIPNVVVTNGITTTVDFALSPGGTIQGTVTDSATGLPIAGIQLLIFDSTWSQYRTLMTSATGTYKANGLPVRSDYRVAAVGNSTYAGQWQSPITVTPGVPVSVSHALLHSGTIAGTVTDTTTLLPVAGIRVNAYDSNGWPCSPGVVTDGSGQYTIVGLPEYSGYTVQTEDNGTYPGQGQSSGPVTIGNTTTVDFSLSPLMPGLLISTATITVDGDAADWAGIDPLITDPQDDALAYFSAYSGSDIKAIYAAKDATNLYIRVDLWGNANTNFGNWPNAPYEGDYRMYIKSNSGLYPTIYLSWAYHSGSQWSIYSNEDPFAGPPVVSSLAGPGNIGVSGNVMEIKLPLSEIGDPSSIFTIFSQVNNCCIIGNPILSLDESVVTSLGAISGTVTDSNTGLPIAGLNVSANGGSWPNDFSGITDAAGHYAFGNLSEGNDFQVQVQGNATYAGQTRNGVSTTYGSMTTVNFTLSAPGTITGKVAESGTGTPIVGLNVNINDNNWQYYGGATTDVSGNYTVSGLPARSDYRVEVQGNATYGGQTQTGVTVNSGATTTVDFALSQAGSISGTVTAIGTGAAIANLDINVCINNQGCPGWAQTDESGNYTVTGLAPRSDYQVQVHGNATYAGQTQESITVISGNTTTVNFSLSEGGSIDGTVTAAVGGAPIAYLNVSICDSHWQCGYGWAQTDMSGHYMVSGLAPRTDYRVQVQGNTTYAGQTQTGISVTAGTTTVVNFSLAPGGSLTGTVRDAVSGVGIGNMGVSVVDPTGWNWLGGTVTGPDGTYRIDGLPQGSWMVNTSSQGQSWYVGQTYNGVIRSDMATLVAVLSGSTTTGIDFNLTKGGTISGIVTTSTGTAIANAEVSAVMPDGSEVSKVKTDGTGAYMLGPVSPGVTVMARAPGTSYVGQYYGGGIYLSSAATVTVVVETNTSGIDIALPVGSVLTGTISVDSAVPADAWIDLYSVTDGNWVMRSTIWGEITDPATGTWSVVVPAGTYKLWAGASNGVVELPNMYYDGTYDFDSATDVVATGTETIGDLNFAFSSLYGSVTGTVSYSGIQTGEVIEWTSPNAGNDWPKMSSGNGSSLGAYTLRSTAGTWYVKAFMDVNHNMIYDAGEPFGENAGGSVVVTNGNTVSGVDIVLTEGTPVPTTSNILWRNTATGENSVWYMDGVTLTGSAFLTPIADQNWTIVGTGDFNNDAKRDILWRNIATGENSVWLMDGATLMGSAFLTPIADQNWIIAGTGDFSNDGKTDILWRNTATGENSVWYMDGTTLMGAAFLTTIADQNWTIVGTGDFNNDAKRDILWRNTATGENSVWYMDGTTLMGAAFLTTIADQNWTIVGTGDFNNDAKRDILWRNTATGENSVWFMDGVTLTGSTFLTTIADQNWKIAGIQ